MSWSRKSSVPGSVKPVYGAKYPPLQCEGASPAIAGHGAAVPVRPAKDLIDPGVEFPTDARFENYQASVSDAWEVEDEKDIFPSGKMAVAGDVKTVSPGVVYQDDLINSDTARTAALAVLQRHHNRQHPDVGAMPLGRNPRAKTHGMQRLAIQKEPIPAPDASGPPASAAQPRLPVFSNEAASPTKASPNSVLDPASSTQRTQKIMQLAQQSTVNLDKLRAECWKGVPSILRPSVWRILSGYVPLNADRRKAVLENKRAEYFNFVEQYYHTRHSEQHQDTFRQIHIDIPRMCPLIPLFQQPVVQEMFERILYICAIRHPASGYVQGINDLVTPFFVVFLSEYISGDKEVGKMDLSDIPREQRDVVEADSFWCVSRLIDTVQDNYTFAQPGVQRKIRQLEDLMGRVDNGLHCHLVKNSVEYLQFAFRWMNNLLMREIPLRCTVRLWDTYLCEPNGFAVFHVYVCAAFLRIWSKQIMQQKDFQSCMLFLQNLPTQSWTDQQISELCADAFSLMSVFSGTKNHLPR